MHIVVIAGPTATGKTRLAASLAYEFDLDIVSADSRQVYRKLNIGSGKDLDEYVINGRKLRRHLIDIADPREIYSLHRYQQDCFKLLEFLEPNKKPVIMAGGTGLYIEAVLKGYTLSQVGEHPAFREEYGKLSRSELQTRLQERNPGLYARTDITSSKRLVRALEIHQFEKPDPPRRCAGSRLKIIPDVFCLDVPRQDLNHRIHQRLQARMEAGMVAETRRLLASGVPADRLLLMGLEYRELTLFIQGEKTEEQMRLDLEKAIRRMAKRQMTYFRGMERRGIPVTWIHPCDRKTISRRLKALLEQQQ